MSQMTIGRSKGPRNTCPLHLWNLPALAVPPRPSSVGIFGETQGGAIESLKCWYFGEPQGRVQFACTGPWASLSFLDPPLVTMSDVVGLGETLPRYIQRAVLMTE